MDLLQALAEPRRREILRVLGDRELSAGEIAAHFTLSQPTISQHLRALREGGLVSERRAGQRRLYQVRPEALAEVWRELATFWDGGLETLRSLLEQDHGTKAE